MQNPARDCRTACFSLIEKVGRNFSPFSPSNTGVAEQQRQVMALQTLVIKRIAAPRRRCGVAVVLGRKIR